MNILFLTLLNIYSIDEHTIYTDLLREFIKRGNMVYVVSPLERRMQEATCLITSERYAILKPKIGNIQKTNLIDKGISTITLDGVLQKEINKYWKDIRFDIIIFSTPPITLTSVIKKIKKRDNAKTYLLLKDIFPQNAIDMGMMRKSGIKGLLYRYFRNKEKKLYALSDKIGCMSSANVEYILKHNPEVSKDKVEICPNCIEPREMRITVEERIDMRSKYDIPINKKVFVYGGNLGKPQDIPFLIKCLRSQKNNQDAFYLVVGDGTEYGKLEKYFDTEKPSNFKLMKKLPKEDYDRMIAACDVGMIFLDHRFTIPNFPSRLLSYMQAGLPVLACTDPSTDIGKVIVDGEFGWWCASDSVESFSILVQTVLSADLKEMGWRGWHTLNDKYSSELGYNIIIA